MRDLLDICHDVTRAKTLGDDADFDVAPDQITRMKALAQELSTGQLTRIWQLLMKAHSDVRLAPVPLAAAEMALLGLAVAGQLPPPEMAAKLIEALRDGTLPAATAAQSAGSSAPAPAPTASPSPIASAPQAAASAPPASAPVMSANASSAPAMSLQAQNNTAPKQAASKTHHIEIKTLEDLVTALETQDIALASDIKRFVQPISFRLGNIKFQPTDDAPISLTGKIVAALQDLTGAMWIVSPEKSGGGETLKAKERRMREEQAAKDRAHPAFSHPLFKDAKLIEIRDIAPTSIPTNIIAGNFRPAEVDDDNET